MADENTNDFESFDEKDSDEVQAALPEDSFDESVATEDEPATSEGCCS